MPTSRIRFGTSQADFIVVKRDQVTDGASPDAVDVQTSSNTKRNDASDLSEYTNDNDEDERSQATTTTITTTMMMATMTQTPSATATKPSVGFLAESEPTETYVVSLLPQMAAPEQPSSSSSGRISQTTEHLLIAAGSIGATIIIVMIVLAIYTMRRRGLSFAEFVKQGKGQVKRDPSASAAGYNSDSKQRFDDDDDFSSVRKEPIYPPLPAISHTRMGSLSSQTTLQALERSDSFKRRELERTSAINGIPTTFQLNNPPARMNSHRRDNSATPSSPFLGVEGPRRSASTHNTRSLRDEEEYLEYSGPPQQGQASEQPTPPSFKQFLSNRPSISQRPGLGGMASRFSWTNSQAPQTPHDPSRDTLKEPLGGRESFMTNRSSVPRFRTINSWVNQQSNRVEERKLKEQYRMTQNSDVSDSSAGGDVVPEMPPMPKDYRQSNGLAGKNIKHQRHQTATSVNTAPVFKQHPGTEVRFSTRSTVPSEILDMGRHNSVLR